MIKQLKRRGIVAWQAGVTQNKCYSIRISRLIDGFRVHVLLIAVSFKYIPSSDIEHYLMLKLHVILSLKASI